MEYCCLRTARCACKTSVGLRRADTKLLRSLIVLGLFYLAAAASVPRSSKAPNFVLIFVDDSGWGDIGANNPEVVETPFIDSLAARGLRFTDFHAGASVCTPSRAALLTGRDGQRTGVRRNFGQGSLGGLPTTEITLAEVLKKGGYSTAMLGKWHLGTHPPYHPSFRGFDRYMGVPYSVDMGCTYNPGADLPPISVCCPEKYSGDRQWCIHPAVPLYNVSSPKCASEQVSSSLDVVSQSSAHQLRRPTACSFTPVFLLLHRVSYMSVDVSHCNGAIVEQPVNLATLASRYGDFAEGYIAERASSEKQQPFFLYVAMNHMHTPIAHAAQYDNVSPRTQRQVYSDALAEVDGEVRRIISALERHGLSNDTFVIVTSDNGPWDMKCELAGEAGPFKGTYVTQNFDAASGKFTAWEGGHRVFTIAYWPGVIQPGVTAALSSALDIFPTFLSLANLSLPDDRRYDGKDLTPVLTRRTDEHHNVLFHPGGYKTGWYSAMRYGKYKAHFNITRGPRCVRDTGQMNWTQRDIIEKFEFIVPVPQEAGGQPLIFDLEADPAESTPLLPPPTEVVDEVLRLLQERMDDIHNDPVRSTVDWSVANDPTGWPCCDDSTTDCSCSPHKSPSLRASHWTLF